MDKSSEQKEWRRFKYYIEDEHGYRISKTFAREKALYTAWTPARISASDGKAYRAEIGCFGNPEDAKLACKAHREGRK